MSAQTTVDQTSSFQKLLAELKIASGDHSGVPQQLADAVAEAGFEAGTGTIAAAGQHLGGDNSLELNNQNGGSSSTWPRWAFELAKGALLSQQCSMAEALEVVTRSGGRGGPGGA